MYYYNSIQHNTTSGIAEALSRVRYTGDEVLGLLDLDGEDGGMEDIFFPGSDEEFGIEEECEEEAIAYQEGDEEAR